MLCLASAKFPHVLVTQDAVRPTGWASDPPRAPPAERARGSHYVAGMALCALVRSPRGHAEKEPARSHLLSPFCLDRNDIFTPESAHLGRYLDQI